MQLGKSLEGVIDKGSKLKRWHKIVLALSVLVIVFTTYVMIKPAMALTPEQAEANKEIAKYTEMVGDGESHAEVVDKGNWGSTNIEWYCVENGDGYALVLTGKGSLTKSRGLRWREDYSTLINKVVIQEGINNNDNVKELFYNLPNLESVCLPENFKYIGREMFAKTNLKMISIPKGVEEIDYKAFHDCKNLEKIVFDDESITKIPLAALGDCKKLKSIEFPKSLREIDPVTEAGDRFDFYFEDISFRNDEFIYSENSIVTRRGVLVHCFADMDQEVITLPKEFTGEVVASAYAYYHTKNDMRYYNTFIAPGVNCIYVEEGFFNYPKKMIMPNNHDVEEIWSTRVREVEVGAVTKLPGIGRYDEKGDRYGGCDIEKLTTANPELVEEVRWKAFYKAKRFNIDLSEYPNLKEIGRAAFYDNISLENIYLGRKIEIIEDKAFSGCVGVKVLDYNVAKTPKLGIDVFEGAKFKNLRIGNTVNTVSCEILDEMMSHAETVNFIGENFFEIDDDSKGYSNSPFEKGKYYVNSDGIVFKYREDGKTADVVYVSKQTDGKANIPAKIPTEKSTAKSIDVVGIGNNPFFINDNGVKEFNFENPKNIVEIGKLAFTNLPDDVKINGKTDKQDIKKLFTNAGKQFDESVNNNETSSMNTNEEIVIVNENDKDCKLKISLADNFRGKNNTFLTGENVVSKIYFSGKPPKEPIGVKVYFQFSNNNGFALPPEIKEGDIWPVLTRGSKPRSLALVFDKIDVGKTFSIQIPCQYQENTRGGDVKIWAEFCEASDDMTDFREVTEVGEVDKDNNIHLRWKYNEESYDMNSKFNSSDVFIEGDGTSKASCYYQRLDLRNDITANNDKIMGNLKGRNMIRYYDVETVVSFSDNISLSKEVVDAIKNNTYQKDYYAMYYINSKGERVSFLTGVGNATVELRQGKDGKEELVIKDIINGGNSARYDRSYRFNEKCLVIKDPSKKITIGDKEVTALLKSKSKAKVIRQINTNEVIESNVAEHPIVIEPAPELWVRKAAKKIVPRSFISANNWGESVEYSLKLWNAGTKEETKTTKFVDNLDPLTYLSYQDMAKLLLDETMGEKEIIIENLSLCKNPEKKEGVDIAGNPIKLTSENVGVDTDYSGESMNTGTGFVPNIDNYRLKLDVNDDGYLSMGLYTKDNVIKNLRSFSGMKLSVEELADEIESFMAKLLSSEYDNGYAFFPNVKTTYKITWHTKKDDSGKHIPIYPGQIIETKFTVSVKDTFYELEKDRPESHDVDKRERIKNEIYYGNDDSELVETGYPALFVDVKKDYFLYKKVYSGDKRIDENGNFFVPPDEILTHNIIVKHLGNGKKRVLPVVEKVIGNNVLLVETDGNEHLEGKGLKRTNDGFNEAPDGKYYILDKEGTYEKVKTRGYIADTIEVKMEKGNFTTLVKWYIKDAEGAYVKTIPFMTVSKDVGSKLNSVVAYTWLNDHQAHRLTHASIGTILRFDKNIVEKVGASPDEDILVENKFSTVEKGQKVTYRIDLLNTGDWPLTLDGSEIYDLLPTTNSNWQWKKDENVKLDFVTTDESISLYNLDQWSIENDPDTYRQKITWKGFDEANPSKGTKIDYKKRSLVYIYCTLEFPDNDSFKKFTEEMNGTYFDNQLYVYNMPVIVNHLAVEEGRAILQKGVLNTIDKDAKDLPTNVRHIFASRDTVGYFIAVCNTGNTPLYLNTIEDILPKEFMISQFSVAHDTDILKTHSGSETIAEIDGESVTLMSGDVEHKITTLKDGRHLVQFDISGGNISFDENVKKYYLNKNEAIYITFGCRLPVMDKSKDSILINKASMAYTDLYDKGIAISNNVKFAPTTDGYGYHFNADFNNGTKQIINNSQAEAEGFSHNDSVKERLYSEVLIRKDEVRPGIVKELYKIHNEDANGTNVANVGDSLEWKITISNDSYSDLHLTDALIVDEFEDPYQIDSVRYRYKNGEWVEGGVDQYKVKRDPNTGRTSYPLLHIKSNEIHSVTLGNEFELLIKTKPITATHKRNTHINNIKLYLPYQEYEGYKVTKGEYVKGKTPEEDYIQAEDQVTVLGNYDTDSYVDVIETQVPNNKASSKHSTNNKISLPNKTKDIHYNLYLDNNGTKKLEDVVMITNMAHIGDGYTDYYKYKRHSKFPIRMDASKSIKVFLTEEGKAERQLEPSEYIVEYSNKKGDFTDTDWNKKGKISADGWHDQLKQDDDVSARFVIKSMPVKGKIRVELPAKIDKDYNASFGDYGWASYSYRYNAEGDNERLSAGTLKVGVGYSGVPQITKKLVDSNGEPRKADKAEIFKFLIYKGEEDTKLPKDNLDKAKAYLTEKKIDFEVVPVRVDQSKTQGTIVLTDKNSGEKTPAINKWLWGDNDGKKFTVLEFMGDDSQYATKSIGGSGRDIYTFTQENLSFENVEAVNRYKEWNLELTKVNKKDRKETIDGVVFGIYSPSEKDKKTDLDLSKYDLTTDQVKDEIVAGDTKYYLCGIGETANGGKLKFENLQQDSYKLVELKTHKDYVIDNEPITVDYNMQQSANKNISIVVTNPKKIILPKTGGKGKYAFIVLGLGLIAAAGTMAFRKYRKI